MTTMCTREPISWLKLEGYALGDLEPSARQEVEVHIAECAACHISLQSIGADTRTLAPLPERQPSRTRWLPQLWALGAFAAGAAALLFAIIPHAIRNDTQNHVKGGDVALVLVRVSDQGKVDEPRTFAENDRFKALVTCEPGTDWFWDMVIFQGDRVYFPLPAGAQIHCGNRIPLAGAFVLTGAADVRVCTIYGDTLPNRQVWESQGLRALGKPSACVDLKAVLMPHD